MATRLPGGDYPGLLDHPKVLCCRGSYENIAFIGSDFFPSQGRNRRFPSIMNTFVLRMVIGTGGVALLLVLLFTYLYEQSRQQYFRAWQLAWGFYTLHYALDAWEAINHPSAPVSFFASLLLVSMTICIYVSTRLMRDKYRPRWDDIALALAGIGLAWWTLQMQMV